MIKLTPIVAKPFKQHAAMSELVKGMYDTTKDFEILLASPTLTWEDKPKFERTVREEPKQIVAVTSTTQDKYVWTSDGTKPHKIRARKPGGVLAFREQKRAKTAPGSLLAQTAQYGNPVTAQEVDHPGTKARNFPRAAKKLARQSMHARMKFAMRLAAKASGHGA